MKIKEGVRVFGLRPEILLAVVVAREVWTQHGAELVITSGIEAKHETASFHYLGLAVDLRSHDPATGQTVFTASFASTSDPAVAASVIASELKAALGPDYDVVLEGDHIHVEFQPKAEYA